jgi:hypothetical protein
VFIILKIPSNAGHNRSFSLVLGFFNVDCYVISELFD